MEIDNFVLFPLSSIIILAVIGIMVGLEIGLASASLPALVYLFGEASKPNAPPQFGILGILFAIVFVLTFFDSVRRILKKRSIEASQRRLREQLVKLRVTGNDLFTKYPSIRDVDKDKWWQEILDWRKDVCSIMNGIRTGDSENWVLLGPYHRREFNGVSTDEMNDKLTRLSILLEKLEGYIDIR